MYLYRQEPRVLVVTNSVTLPVFTPKEVTTRRYIPRTVRRIQWIQMSINS